MDDWDAADTWEQSSPDSLFSPSKFVAEKEGMLASIRANPELWIDSAKRYLSKAGDLPNGHGERMMALIKDDPEKFAQYVESNFGALTLQSADLLSFRRAVQRLRDAAPPIGDDVSELEYRCLEAAKAVYLLKFCAHHWRGHFAVSEIVEDVTFLLSHIADNLGGTAKRLKAVGNVECGGVEVAGVHSANHLAAAIEVGTRIMDRIAREIDPVVYAVAVEGADIDSAALGLRLSREAVKADFCKITAIARGFPDYHPQPLLDAIKREAAALREKAAIQPRASPDLRSAPRLTVDVATRTATLDGQSHDLKSEKRARWLKVLAERPGEWVSGPDMERHDRELVGGVRTCRERAGLPHNIKAIVETSNHDGARIKLA